MKETQEITDAPQPWRKRARRAIIAFLSIAMAGILGLVLALTLGAPLGGQLQIDRDPGTLEWVEGSANVVGNQTTGGDCTATVDGATLVIEFTGVTDTSGGYCTVTAEVERSGNFPMFLQGIAFSDVSDEYIRTDYAGQTSIKPAIQCGEEIPDRTGPIGENPVVAMAIAIPPDTAFGTHPASESARLITVDGDETPYVDGDCTELATSTPPGFD